MWGMDSIYLTQDRDSWRSHVNAMLNIRIPRRQEILSMLRIFPPNLTSKYILLITTVHRFIVLKFWRGLTNRNLKYGRYLVLMS
jgi:hypothetical protein